MVQLEKKRVDEIVEMFYNWLNTKIDDKTECTNNFYMFEKFCKSKKAPVKSCIKIFKEKNINCDCEILGKWT